MAVESANTKVNWSVYPVRLRFFEFNTILCEWSASFIMVANTVRSVVVPVNVNVAVVVAELPTQAGIARVVVCPR